MVIQLLSIRVSEENIVLAVQWYNPATGVVSTATEDGIVDYIAKGGKAIICNGETIEALAVTSATNEAPRLYLNSAGPGTPLPLPHL